MSPRIVMVSLHPSSAGQAAATHTSNIAAVLREEGWDVVLTHTRSTADTSAMRRVLGWTSALLRSAFHVRGTAVIYIRSHPAALPLTVMAQILGVPIVQEVNGPHEDYLQAWPRMARVGVLVTRPLDWQLRTATGIVAVTEGLSAWVTRRVGRHDAVVIPNGVDVELFAPGATPTLPVPDRYVAFVGALAPWQGLDLLLAATTDDTWPDDVALLIAGDGQDRDLILRAAQQRPGRIRWLGQIDHHRVPGVLANALAAIVTSADRAGTGLAPIKLYEAMAAGVPVVVSEVASLAETVRAERCGTVLSTPSPAALATAVAELAADQGLRHRLGANARHAAVARHSWQHRGAQTSAVLAAAHRSREYQ